MEYKNLCSLCTLIMGQSPDSTSYNKDGKGLPFYQGNADFGEINPTPTVWCNAPKKIAEKNDILISVRAPIGDMNIANERCCIGRGLAAIRINNTNLIDRDYLYHFLDSIVINLQEQGTGSTFKAINKGALESISIPCLSMEKQKAVSRILVDLKYAIKKKEQQLSEFDDLIKSRFIEMFGDKFDNANEHCKIKDVCTATIGLTYKPENVSHEGTIVLRSGNIQNNALQVENDIVRVVNTNISEEKLIKPNDILMCSRNGSARLVGKSCLITSVNEPMSFGAFMTVVRCSYPYFMQAFFTSDYFRQQLTGTKTASVNQITTKMLYDYTTIKPSKQEENEFADFVKLIDKSKFIVQKQIDDLQELLDSKMDKYFG